MFVDSFLQIANATSVVQATGTALIGSQIDTAIAGTLEMDDLYLVLIVTTAIVAAGAGTVTFQLASDTTAAISTTAAQIGFQTAPFVTSTSGTLIPAGSVLMICQLPKNQGIYNPNKRFLGLLQVTAGNLINAGAVSAFLTTDVGKWAAQVVVAN